MEYHSMEFTPRFRVVRRVWFIVLGDRHGGADQGARGAQRRVGGDDTSLFPQFDAPPTGHTTSRVQSHARARTCSTSVRAVRACVRAVRAGRRAFVRAFVRA